MKENTDLFHNKQRFLHVAPKYCLSRSFSKLENLDYKAIALENDFNINALMDLTSMAIQSDTIDSVVCIHVLEHIDQDREAMRELYRVLKPGRWAALSVPIQLDEKTYENPNIVSAEDRKREFGERDHVRVYGYDLTDRLKEAGFMVELHLAEDIQKEDMDKFGLLNDENIFLVTKPENKNGR